MNSYPDLQAIEDQLGDAERDAASLALLDDERGAWRPGDGTWSVAECLDHLAMTNRIYLRAMGTAAQQARQRGSLRRGPATPGIVGRLFVAMNEPPVKRMRIKAPPIIRPQAGRSLSEAFQGFVDAQKELGDFLRANADLDLAGTRFDNPFIKGIPFSLATGLHALAAHERRHIWQARKVCESMPSQLKATESESGEHSSG